MSLKVSCSTPFYKKLLRLSTQALSTHWGVKLHVQVKKKSKRFRDYPHACGALGDERLSLTRPRLTHVRVWRRVVTRQARGVTLNMAWELYVVVVPPAPTSQTKVCGRFICLTIAHKPPGVGRGPGARDYYYV